MALEDAGDAVWICSYEAYSKGYGTLAALRNAPTRPPCQAPTTKVETAARRT
jgi:hypothetical protein